MTFNTYGDKANSLFVQAIGKFLLGVILIGLSVFALLPALCRSLAGKYLLVTDYRGAGGSEGDRHGAIWNRTASDVSGHHGPVSGNAAGTCFALFFPYYVAFIPLIAKRIKNEEKVLEEGLEGYKEYKQKVKYKVIPFIW